MSYSFGQGPSSGPTLVPGISSKLTLPRFLTFFAPGLACPTSACSPSFAAVMLAIFDAEATTPVSLAEESDEDESSEVTEGLEVMAVESELTFAIGIGVASLEGPFVAWRAFFRCFRSLLLPSLTPSPSWRELSAFPLGGFREL